MATKYLFRSYAFPVMMLAGAAAFVLASLFLTLPASAARSGELALHPVLVAADQLDRFVIHVKPDVFVAASEVSGPDLTLVAAASAPVLAPEYADSLKTDALNFIETRLRC